MQIVMVNTTVMKIRSGVQNKNTAPLNSVITGLCLLTLIFLPCSLNAAENIDENDSSKTVQETAEQSEDATMPAESEAVVPLSPEQQEKIQQALSNREQYTQLINQLELEAGADAYRPELSQAYMDLGLTLQDLEQHDEATEAFDKALQSVRISDGLNSALQLPMLQELYNSNLARADWEGADLYAHLMFYVARKSFAAGDERRLAALEQMGNWKLKAENENLLSEYSNALGSAIETYQHEIELLQSMPLEGNNLTMATLYLGEARLKMILAQQIYDRPLTEYQTPGRERSTTTTRCFFVRLANGSVTQMCETIEVPQLDFYTVPNDMKLREISGNLKDIREALVKAFTLLQIEMEQVEKRDELLAEMNQITESYNTFVTEHSM
ncbi:tetratricopeptide repeat protein [Gammaproteobacteria bacterium]|nr:tetratricopeptide repeat protein [Gammaproteobacteria bacterium]